MSLSDPPVLMAAEMPLPLRAGAPLPPRRAIWLLYPLLLRRGRRRRRRRQVAVEGQPPPPPPPPLMDEERRTVSPSGHLLMDISLSDAER